MGFRKAVGFKRWRGLRGGGVKEVGVEEEVLEVVG